MSVFLRFALIVALATSIASCSRGSSLAREIAPPASHPCFPGAYYRKAVSSKDHWQGIEGIVTLPEIHFDESRFDPGRGRYLDNASVYMGGHAGVEQEIDAGVTWSIIREADGSVSRMGKAFRPFWRNEAWHNAPAEPQYYYYPGDTLYMRAQVVAPGRMELEVTLLSRGPNAPAGSPMTSTFTTVFDAVEFGPGIRQEFKRVNAIDQFGREGEGVEPTATRVVGARWEEVYLWRGGARVPFTPRRFTDMRCPDPQHVIVDGGRFHDLTAEMITIDGAGR